MRVSIVAVGKLRRGPERELVTRYVDRCRALGRTVGLSGPDIVELPDGKPRDIAMRRAAEAQSIRAACGDAAIVLLDEFGGQTDSVAFARNLGRRAEAGGNRLAFVIGGADGVAHDLREAAAEVMSFGRLTLPHQIVRILLVEQLYRAMTILSGHPYHRE